jgi:hypothetical protein
MVKDFVVENTASEAGDAGKGDWQTLRALKSSPSDPKISDNALVVSSDASDLASVTNFLAGLEAGKPLLFTRTGIARQFPVHQDRAYHEMNPKSIAVVDAFSHGIVSIPSESKSETAGGRIYERKPAAIAQP